MVATCRGRLSQPTRRPELCIYCKSANEGIFCSSCLSDCPIAAIREAKWMLESSLLACTAGGCYHIMIYDGTVF